MRAEYNSHSTDYTALYLSVSIIYTVILTDYPQFTDTYIVHRTTGCGEQGGEPIRQHEIIGSANTWDEALKLGRALFPPHPSGWTYDSFCININTLTEKGKERLQKHQDNCAELEADRLARPELWDTVKIEAFELHFQRNPAFDTPAVGYPLESYKFINL
jgi:hypothetical protein